MSKQTLKIEICMGSSCFSRGNNITLPLLQSLINENNLDAQLELSGSLCSENCTHGPVLVINGKKYHQVHPNAVEDLLLHCVKEECNE